MYKEASQQLMQLINSAGQCSVQDVATLMSKGADSLGAVGICGKKGTRSPLMAAINRRCSPQLVTSLLSMPDKSQINFCNDNGDTALSLAILVYDGQSCGDLLKELKEAGADFATKPSFGSSIISLALRNKYSLKQIRFMIESGAQVNGADIGEALKLSRLDIAAILLASFVCDSTQLPLPTQLPHALSLLVKNFDPKRATSGQLHKVFKKLLFECQLDVNYGDNLNLPLLHILILKWKKPFTALLNWTLLAKDVNVDITSYCSPLTPLTLALNLGRNRVAEKLILVQADVHKATVTNMTLSPGLSGPLKLLHIHGAKIPPVFGHYPRIKLVEEDEESGKRRVKRDTSRHVTLNELSNFKEWLKCMPPAFPSLQTLAAKCVRPLYGHYLTQFKAASYGSHFQEKFAQMVFLDGQQ